MISTENQSRGRTGIVTVLLSKCVDVVLPGTGRDKSRSRFSCFESLLIRYDGKR